MGLPRSANAALPEQHKPTLVNDDGSVASEPAYITSWESKDMCAPPRLALDDPLVSDLDTMVCAPQYLKLGYDVAAMCAPPRLALVEQCLKLGYDVGNVLKSYAGYDHIKVIIQAPQQSMYQPDAAASLYQDVQDVKQYAMPGDDAVHVPRRHVRRRKRRSVLRHAYLDELEHEDPNKVLIVRKITRMGFDSSRILKEHYSSIGAVSKVLLSNQHERQSDLPLQVRLRPSGIAFLVFETAESAARALAQGATQTVAGVEVSVCAFEKRLSDEDEDAGEDSSTS